MSIMRAALEGVLVSLGIKLRKGQEPVVNNTITVLAAGAQTLTAAQLLGGVIEHPVTASITDTLDTAANLDLGYQFPQVGDTFLCQVINTAGGAFTVTLAGGAGVTIKGATVIGQGKSAFVSFLRTGAGAWTAYVTLSA